MFLNISDLTVSFKVINFNFQIFLLFVPEMSIASHFLHCLDYVHYFVLDPVTIAF
jgi:hypothetical protein